MGRPGTLLDAGPNAAADSLVQRVIGAAIEVHRVLGPGLLESIYESALCVELVLARIPFERQVPVMVNYKGQDIGEKKLDLLVGRELVVELKAVDGISPVHIAQVLSYLKIKHLRLGLLVNFNVTRATTRHQAHHQHPKSQLIERAISKAISSRKIEIRQS